MAFLQPATTMSSNQEEPSPSAPATESEDSSLLSRRSARQFGLFAAGAGFFAISSLITRRSLLRRYKATIPSFYQPSNRPPPVNGAMEAFEALNVATVNVASLALMLTGGAMWAFNISTLDDFRQLVRKNMGMDGPLDKEAEEEMEQWLASILARRDIKEVWNQVKSGELDGKTKEAKDKTQEPETEASRKP